MNNSMTNTDDRIAQLEATVSSLSRRETPTSTVTVREVSRKSDPSLQVRWLASKETITTSATSTGGYVQHRLTNVPDDAVAVIVEVYGATGALALQPTVTVTWKAEENTAELTPLKHKASSLAGDAAGYGGLMLPVSGGAFYYNVSSDWSEIELYVTGFLSLAL